MLSFELLTLLALVNAVDDFGGAGWNNERGNIIHRRRPIHVGPLDIARPLDKAATTNLTPSPANVGTTTASMSGSVVEPLAIDEVRKPLWAYRCDVTDREHLHLRDDEYYFVLNAEIVRDGARADAPVIVETQAFCFTKAETSVDNNARIWADCWQCDPSHVRHTFVFHPNLAVWFWIAVIIVALVWLFALLLFSGSLRFRKLVRHYLRLGRDEPPIDANVTERK